MKPCHHDWIEYVPTQDRGLTTRNRVLICLHCPEILRPENA